MMLNVLLMEELEEATAAIQAIVTVAMETILLDNAYIPRQLFETAVVFHGILPSLPEQVGKLQLNIVRLCEMWWLRDITGKEDLVVEAIMILLQRTVQPKGTMADVKRVNRLRSGLECVDLMAESSETLRGLLQQSLSTSIYLRCDEGQKFLSFLFGLNIDFISCLHETVKSEIPVCSK
ncbi:hypothetical protein NP493_1362g01023 [Ridgeia piscesae]|uniref:Uncharacterized protein n=1 Tax=Ridgeia piscesae TaxID=27915 RepID=A0AAD9NCR9_RIDPI|nr:hypothetical protein NP493_1362g01023 [Ridgeia piscesae]